MKNPYRIDKEVAEIVAKLDYLDDYLSRKVADSEEFEYLRYLLELHDRVEKARGMVKAVNEIHWSILKEELLDTQDYEEEEETAVGTDKQPEVRAFHLRRLTVSVTQGMINQNLLTLTRAIKGGVIKPFEQMRIQLPSGEAFASQVVKPGNKLKERGLIRRFYQEHGVKAGDRLLLKENAIGQWELVLDFDHRKRWDGFNENPN